MAKKSWIGFLIWSLTLFGLIWLVAWLTTTYSPAYIILGIPGVWLLLVIFDRSTSWAGKP